MVEPGQMDIFDFVEETEPPQEIVVAAAEPEPEVKKPERVKSQIRLNEYHLDKAIVGKGFTDWVAAAGKKLGDMFTIREVNQWQLKNKGAGKS